jgi:hypothetical protein
MPDHAEQPIGRRTGRFDLGTGLHQLDPAARTRHAYEPNVAGFLRAAGPTEVVQG